MEKRLQVVLDDSEYERIQYLAQSQNIPIEEWVRQGLHLALHSQSSKSIDEKLAAIRAAMKYEFPVGDIDSMLNEIERGYKTKNRRPCELYLRPSRFCASTNPRGVGNSNTETSPSASRRNASSRTLFIAELASWIRIRP